MTTHYVTLAGGLELSASKRSAVPGTLQFCKNFEIDRISQGYRKAPGFVRYDGRSVWVPESGMVFYQIVTTAAPGIAQNWAPGEALLIGPPDQSINLGTAAYAVLCNFSAQIVGPNTQYTMTVGVTLGVERPTAGAIISNFTLTGDPDLLDLTVATVSGGTDSSIGGGNTAQHDSVATAMESAYNALCTKVPGGRYTRIAAAMIYRNAVYVIADYRAILLVSATGNITPLEGDVIRKTSDSSVIGKVVSASLFNAGESGTLVIDTAGYADVSLALNDDVEVFRSSTAYVLGDYTQDLTTGGSAGMLTCGYNNDYSYTALDDSSDPTQNRWQRVSLGRELRYNTGTTEPIPYQRPGYVADLEPSSSVTVFADECSSTSANWQNTANGTGAGDNTYVDETFSGTITPPLDFKFDLSGVPDGATITGVQVTLRRRAGTASRVSDLSVSFTGAASNYADTATKWSTVVADKVYGSSTDTWGGPVSVETVKDEEFLVRFQGQRSAASDIFVDSCSIQIWYSPQTTTAYIWDGATDVATIQIVHYTVEAGSFADDDAVGVMVVDGLLPDAEKTTLVSPGMQIRSAPSGGGNVIAVVASPDTPITLPGSVSVQNAGFRYQLTEGRPYAADNTQVMFICNGLGPAVMFDGTHAIPLRTGLEAEFEKPIHAAWWNANLFLAYAPGSIQVSATGDPTTFIASASDAQEIAVGDFITGLIPLKGQALAVTTRRSMFAIYGRTTETFDLQTISPDVGALPYSTVNVGTPMLCDQNGIHTLAAVQEYGNFARAGLSDAVTPWLRGRLQNYFGSTVAFRPDAFIAAIPIRYKRQLRLYFADGWFLTGTLRPEGSMEFMTGRYELDHEDNEIGCQVLALSSGVFDDGSEMVFFSMANRFENDENRYLYRADCGRRFDSTHMHCSFVTNFHALNGSMLLAKVDRATIFGEAYATNAAVSFGLADSLGDYPTVTPVVTADVAWYLAGNSTPFAEVAFNAGLYVYPLSMMRTVDVSREGYSIATSLYLNAEGLDGGLGNAPVTFQEIAYVLTPTSSAKK